MPEITGVKKIVEALPDAAADREGECEVFDERIAIDTARRETGTTEEEVFSDPADSWRLARARRLGP